LEVRETRKPTLYYSAVRVTTKPALYSFTVGGGGNPATPGTMDSEGKQLVTSITRRKHPKLQCKFYWYYLLIIHRLHTIFIREEAQTH
jgi:hypothetical protein